MMLLIFAESIFLNKTSFNKYAMLFLISLTYMNCLSIWILYKTLFKVFKIVLLMNKQLHTFRKMKIKLKTLFLMILYCKKIYWWLLMLQKSLTNSKILKISLKILMKHFMKLMMFRMLSVKFLYYLSIFKELKHHIRILQMMTWILKLSSKIKMIIRKLYIII